MRCRIQPQLTVTCFVLFLLANIELILSQDEGGEGDFGSGDYSDTGGTEPVIPGTGGSGTGGGGSSNGGGGGSNDGGFGGGDQFPGLEPDPLPLPPPRRGGGGGGGNGGGAGGQVPRPRPNNTPASYPRPAYPRPAYPRPAYPRPRYDPRPWQRANQTDRPWVQDGIEEDTLWNRLINFISNLTNDVGNVQGNEYIDFVGYQLNRFIDVFRYQGYDANDHFHHCTQRVGGCPYYPDRRPPTGSSTTTTESPEEAGGDGGDGGEGETENLSASRRPTGNRTRVVARNQTAAAVLKVPVTSRNQSRRTRTRNSKTVFRTINVN